MNSFIQALANIILPHLLEAISKNLRVFFRALRDNSTRPYIDKIFSVLLGLVLDEKTPVNQRQGELIIKGLKNLTNAFLENDSDNESTNIKPWTPYHDEK